MSFTREMMKKGLVSLLRPLFELSSESIEKKRLPAGTVFVIAPHPDDETLGCGGLILHLRAQGVRVRVIVVTDGRASSPSAKITPDELVKIRRAETHQATKLLGLEETDLVFLDYPDGEAFAHYEKILKDLEAQFWMNAPSLVLAPYALDGHLDHAAVAQAIHELHASGKLTCRVLSYPMWFWPRAALMHLRHPTLWRTHRVFDVRPYLKQKAQAVKAYRSQFENLTGEAEWPLLAPIILDQSLRSFELYFETAEGGIQTD